VWSCTVPSHRYDLRLEVDLIEEVARLYGYDRIRRDAIRRNWRRRHSRDATFARTARSVLAARGWQEVVTYSFVEPKLQQQLAPDLEAIRLATRLPTRCR